MCKYQVENVYDKIEHKALVVDNVVNVIMMEKEAEAWQDLIGADPNEMQL
jgi:hypothetical protein